MLNYRKLYEPFTVDGASLEGSISWVKKTTGADQRIIDQVVAETMNLVHSGNKFDGPCVCGCEGGRAHTKIEHFMRKAVEKLSSDVEQHLVTILEEKQKALLQSEMKQLSNFDKEYDKMVNGSWWQKNIPTFRKWLRIKD
jgi:hypothetical protein